MIPNDFVALSFRMLVIALSIAIHSDGIAVAEYREKTRTQPLCVGKCVIFDINACTTTAGDNLEKRNAEDDALSAATNFDFRPVAIMGGLGSFPRTLETGCDRNLRYREVFGFMGDVVNDCTHRYWRIARSYVVAYNTVIAAEAKKNHIDICQTNRS